MSHRDATSKRGSEWVVKSSWGHWVSNLMDQSAALQASPLAMLLLVGVCCAPVQQQPFIAHLIVLLLLCLDSWCMVLSRNDIMPLRQFSSWVLIKINLRGL